MKQLYFDCGVENLLFIRYNPDTYKPLQGKPDSDKKRREFLVKYLKETIKTGIEHLGVVYLYYDGHSVDLEVEKLDPYA